MIKRNSGIDLMQENVFDAITINLHLLGRQGFTNPYQFLAADVNGDNSLDVLDIVSISRQILRFTERFPGEAAEPWFFVPAGYEFINPEFPYAENTASSIDFSQVPPTEINQSFVAIRLGDVNADVELDARNQPPGLLTWCGSPQ